MSKLTGFVVSVVMLCMAGVARAAEIADVPVTEMNYTGILVFLGVFVGGFTLEAAQRVAAGVVGVGVGVVGTDTEVGEHRRFEREFQTRDAGLLVDLRGQIERCRHTNVAGRALLATGRGDVGGRHHALHTVGDVAADVHVERTHGHEGARCEVPLDVGIEVGRADRVQVGVAAGARAHRLARRVGVTTQQLGGRRIGQHDLALRVHQQQAVGGRREQRAVDAEILNDRRRRACGPARRSGDGSRRR